MHPDAGITTGSVQSTHRSGLGMPLPYVQPVQDLLVQVFRTIALVVGVLYTAAWVEVTYC